MIGLVLGLLGASLAGAALGGGLNYAAQKDAQSFNASQAEKTNAFNAEQAELNRTFNAEQAELNRNFQANQVEKTNAFNASQASLNRDWLSHMSSTAYQRAVSDAKKAGLNVGAIGAGFSPASVPSSGIASGLAASGSQASGYAVSGVSASSPVTSWGSAAVQGASNALRASILGMIGDHSSELYLRSMAGLSRQRSEAASVLRAAFGFDN